jgi:hypothetical protein
LGYIDGAFVRGTLDPAFGWTLPTNDLVWWVPFGLILWAAWRHHRGLASTVADPVPAAEAGAA